MIKLRSVLYDNYLKPLSNVKDTSKVAYLLKTNGDITVKYDEHGRLSIKPSGGPTIKVGKLLKEVEKEVKQITHTPLGYIISV